MTDDENDTRYPHDPYGVNHQNFPIENVDDDNDDDDDDDDGDGDDGGVDDDDDDDDEGNGVQRIGKDEYERINDDNDEDYGDLKHPKKRKLKTLLSSYEFAPRLPASSSAPPSKPSHGGRNPLTDWTEHETFILLDAWGDRFLKQGRKSLRSEEWQQVAEKVSHESKIERTDTQCRNRLDTLKKKYKKEKTKPGGPTNNWAYFKKMDSLLSPPLAQRAGLSCGVDSGEFVFMNPKVYLNRSNALDEMRDSPGNSENESILPKRRKNGRGPFKLLADSIKKFGDVYKKMESCKREQMVEIEKMRMDFHRDLEMQKREILERARVEIEKIRRGDDDVNDVSN